MKLKDKMDDEIKLAGLEALVPEDLEKHLILNSNRLRTFEDARLEIVTYVEAKFGSRIRDSKRSGTGAREHSDPLDVDAINSLACTRTPASNRLAKANRACHGPRLKEKEGAKRTRRNPKDSPKDPKVPKAHARVKHRKLVSQVLKT